MLYNRRVYNKFVSSEVLNFLEKSTGEELSSLIIDLLKVKFFIKSEKILWYRIGLLSSIGKKLDLILNCFPISPSTKNFLLNLLEKDFSFTEIENTMNFVCENLKNKSDIEFIVCTTAFELLEEDKASLLSKLKSIFDKKIYIEYIIDRYISGGCKIEFRDYCIDASYQKFFSDLVKKEIRKELRWRELNANN